jgi:Holliday junction resolvasome RuvABC endonuclease subunit
VINDFLGLDLSLTSTGYAYGENTGVISFDKSGPERLWLIKREIESLIIANSVQAVILEGYSFASRSGQAFSIGELGGVIRLLLWDIGIPYVTVPPTCRAKFATGKGNASKNEVISSVSARTGVVWQNPGADDKCDAWILQEMGLAHIGNARFNWPAQNIDALNKVDWTPLDKKGNK